MKKLLSFFVLLVFAGAVFANGVSLNSPGARAIAMGGAYISIANDYSAPYWNPAGLVGINGMQAGLFITDIMPSATYKSEAIAPSDSFPGWPAIDAESKAMHVIAPNAAFLWKCKLHEKLHLGLSFLVPAGLAVEWDGADLAPLAAGYVGDWKSSIGVYNISLSLAGQLTEKLNFGWAFHYVHGSMTMDKATYTDIPGFGTFTGQFSEESSGSGLGFGAGVQYECSSNTTLGLAMRSDMSVKFEGEAKNTVFPQIGYPLKSDFSRTITWPLWVGGGCAHRFGEKLLVAAELQWSNWTDFEQELEAEYDNTTWAGAMATTGGNVIHLKWKDATQIRLGMEYLLNSKIALRCGAYLDPAPGPDKTQTILIPNTDFTVITGGFGFNPTEKIAIDFGAEYLMGAERDVDSEYIINGEPGMPGKHGLGILAVSVGLTYKF